MCFVILFDFYFLQSDSRYSSLNGQIKCQVVIFFSYSVRDMHVTEYQVFTIGAQILSFLLTVSSYIELWDMMCLVVNEK